MFYDLFEIVMVRNRMFFVSARVIFCTNKDKILLLLWHRHSHTLSFCLSSVVKNERCKMSVSKCMYKDNAVFGLFLVVVIQIYVQQFKSRRRNACLMGLIAGRA